eukprot:m.1020836 g.1020836  ORF g.1020836 m.1020836 type:complete len:364 (+) comp24092_c0_seq2:168-1259(+)
MPLCARTISGPLEVNNYGATDWGANGLLAYGCHNNIVVADPYSGQIVQTLVGGHNGPVTRCKLRPQPPQSTSDILLLSGDTSGAVLIWNVLSGKAVIELRGDGKHAKAFKRPVVDLDWIVTAAENFVLLLHASAQLTLWTEKGDITWTVPFNETLTRFTIDPFNESRVCLVTQDSLVLVSDFSLTTAPVDLQNKYSVTGLCTASRAKQSDSGDGAALKAYFSPLDKDLLMLVFPREILVMDLSINQTIGQIVLERNGSPFQDILLSRERPVVFCLHQNGCISARGRRSQDFGGIHWGDHATASHTGMSHDVCTTVSLLSLGLGFCASACKRHGDCRRESVPQVDPYVLSAQVQLNTPGPYRSH